MTLCTRCAKVEVPEPASIEDDPLCSDCIKAILHEIADRSMGELTIADVDPSHTPGGFAPDGLGAPRDEDETVPFPRPQRKPVIKCRGCGEKFEGRLRDRYCSECR